MKANKTKTKIDKMMELLATLEKKACEISQAKTKKEIKKLTDEKNEITIKIVQLSFSN